MGTGRPGRGQADRGFRDLTIAWRVRSPRIASLTHGQYFHARSGADLSSVYSALKSRLVLEKKTTEITAFFALAAGVLTLLAASLSLWWYGRVA